MLESFLAHSKTRHCWTTRLMDFLHFWNLKISSRSRGSFINVLILIIVWIISNHSRRGCFLRKYPAFYFATHRTCIVLYDLFRLFAGLVLTDCSLPLIHCPDGLTCEPSRWLIWIKWLHCFDIVWARPNVIWNFRVIPSFLFSVRPNRAALCSFFGSYVIMAWSNLILFFSFVDFERRFIKLEFVIFNYGRIYFNFRCIRMHASWKELMGLIDTC